jgi:hypothetical protein
MPPQLGIHGMGCLDAIIIVTPKRFHSTMISSPNRAGLDSIPVISRTSFHFSPGSQARFNRSEAGETPARANRLLSWFSLIWKNGPIELASKG